jgi:UDP-glucose 4-epimerase
LDSKRILITGLSTYWGGRLAQALEQEPEVEAIIGIDRTPPKFELERTEFVQVADTHSLIRRIVEAAEIDTVVDTRLVVDAAVTTPRRAHENNVIGTMNVLAACNEVRKVIIKSSAHYYGCEQDDPAFFTEAMEPKHPARTPIERDIREAESLIADFSRRHPDKTVTVLRFVNSLGPTLKTSHTRLFSLPVLPAILGFDPRYQFIHEDDIANALQHAVMYDMPGAYNAAGDGVLALSEVASLLGKTFAPILPPWGTGLGVQALRRAGVRMGPEVTRQLRFGRALDNRRLKSTGFRFRYTTRETVVKLREHQRLHPLLRGGGEPYRYEREVEEFLRWSPYVRRGEGAPAWRPTRRQLVDLQKAIAAVEGETGRQISPAESLETLGSEELIALLPSMEPDGLEALREHEAAHANRREVLVAIDSLLARAKT